MENYRSRLELKINKGECWLWTGLLDDDGYGTRIRCHYKRISPHRLSYILNVGEIPEGHIIRHKCRNRNCVKPDHLETGTPKENTADMFRDGTIAKGEKQGSHKLTENQVREIRLRSDEIQNKLAKEYGVSRSVINKIILRKSWAWL